MDLSISVRVEMKYAGGSLAAATWDDRRPIYVRRPEASGALLMRGPDSSLPRKLHVTRTNVRSRVISPEYTRICCLTFLRKHPRPSFENASSRVCFPLKKNSPQSSRVDDTNTHLPDRAQETITFAVKF